TTGSPPGRASPCPHIWKHSSRSDSSASRRWSAGWAGHSDRCWTPPSRGWGVPAPQPLLPAGSGRQSRGRFARREGVMQSTRTLFLLSLVVVMGCATEKAAEKPAAVSPPAIKNFALTAGDEVPPCSAAGPGAQGQANVTLSPDESSVVTTVSY